MGNQTKKVTRIYQGRVSECEINGKKQFLSVLWEHHQLYQDAVNYYLCALASMAADSGSPIGKMRERITASPADGGVWENFWRNGEERSGMKFSLARTLKVDPETLTFQMASERILGTDHASEKILQASVDLIAKKCAGDVTQPGRTYSPLLCNPKFSGNFDFDVIALQAGQGSLQLQTALFREDAVSEIQKLAPEISMRWADIKTQDGEPFQGEESREKLVEAVDCFEKDVKNIRAMNYLRSHPHRKENLNAYRMKIPSLPELKIERNKKTDLERRNALLLLKYFPDEFTVGLMRCFIPEGKRKAVLENPYGLPDDPIKLARAKRGFVFPYFSTILTGRTWRKEFEICAFSEALKTVNQFQQKCGERQTEQEILQADLDYMDGIRGKRVGSSGDDSEDGEDSPLPVLAGDPRWDLLLELLKELGVSNSFTEDEMVEYGLSFRTIRSFSELRRSWQEILKSSGEKDPMPELVRKLHLFQQKNPERMGSADLFHKLAEAKYRDLWRENYPAEKQQSRDLLSDAVRYFEIRERLERLKEPIQFTPADAVCSSRQCDLKRLCVGTRPLEDPSVCRTQIAVRNQDGVFELQNCSLRFSAPRLRRDGLLGGESFRYLTPILNALHPESVPAVDLAESAVFLMPERDDRGEIRYLLNFSIGVPVEELQASFPHHFSANQFYFAENAHQMLLWPGIENGKNKPDWFCSKKPFVFASVDLGQRTAGAVARIRVSPGRPSNPHAVLLGSDGSTEWYAERIYAGLLRLSGEDAKSPGKNGMEKERFGSRGRPANPEETKEARELCIRLSGSDLLGEADSFPEQNDRILTALRRAQAKWSRINRWLWMLNSPERAGQALREYSASLPETAGAVTDADALRSLLTSQEACWRTMLPETVLILARRILPLRDRIWKWETCRSGCGESFRLIQVPAERPIQVRICGQRGISFARLEQLEEFRKRVQSLNRGLMRSPGSAPQRPSEMRELRIPDPCPDVLLKLNRMKENRINQTANLILAQALGLRLKRHIPGRRPEDVHGEYERIPGVEPASFLVLENLSRYRFRQDRSRFENSRLMKWSHRQIRLKLEMLATEILGLPVLDVPAAYSSKFTSEGIPGFRAELCSTAVFRQWGWERLSVEGQTVRALQETAEKLEKLGERVLLPKEGGPLFVPFCGSDVVSQADINAAFNIGLRAVAHPAMLTIHNRIRVRKSKNGLIPVRNSNLAKMVFSETDRIESPGAEEPPNVLFVLPLPRTLLSEGQKGIYRFADSNRSRLTLIPGKELWATVKKEKWMRCLALNRMRLAAAEKRAAERSGK